MVGVVPFFKCNNLCLYQADKSSGSVAMDVDLCNFKAGQAVYMNFVKLKPIKTRVLKSKVVALCKDFKLAQLAQSIAYCS